MFERETATTLICEPNSLEPSHQSHCTATVKDLIVPGSTSPGGVVKFSSDASGSFSAEECELSGSGDTATCAVDYTPAATGTQTITAKYGGDAIHQRTQASTQISVKDPTSTSIKCDPDPQTVGRETTCTATVEDIAASPSVPTGSVDFERLASEELPNGGHCELGPGVEGKKASCSVPYIASAAGRLDIKATYAGDTRHFDSSGLGTLTATEPEPGEKDDTRTTLSCSPGTAELERPTHCTVTVKDLTSVTTTPEGTVDLHTDSFGVFSSPCELSGSGDTATCSVDYTPFSIETGEHILLGTFPANSTQNESVGEFKLRVIAERAPTETTLSCLPGTLVVGNASVCTATVADPALDGSRPKETVRFSSGSEGKFSAATCNLSSRGAPNTAACSVTYSPEKIGDHEITAAYSGDEAHAESSKTTTIHALVEKDETATALECNPKKLASNETSTCVVTVKDTSAPRTPGNIVAFSHSNQGSFSEPTCTLNFLAEGEARCSVTYTPTNPGDHEITAIYQGDSVHLTSQAVTHLKVPGRSTKPPRRSSAAPRS